ncbi:MAG TPA: DoxX family protein [Phycisphaerales bacterium]|nr:DoxX family protein [Phycisphaerales bacterium]
MHDSTKHNPPATGWLSLICRVLLGGLFIFAGILKLGKPQGFADAIMGFKMFDVDAHSHIIVTLTYVIPWTEIVAGTFLVLGLWARASAAVIVSMLTAFIVGVISVIVRGIDTKCSCFGELEWPCTGGVGWCQVVRNCVMIAMAIPVFFYGGGSLAVGKRSAE